MALSWAALQAMRTPQRERGKAVRDREALRVSYHGRLVQQQQQAWAEGAKLEG